MGRVVIGEGVVSSVVVQTGRFVDSQQAYSIQGDVGLEACGFDLGYELVACGRATELEIDQSEGGDIDGFAI